LRQARPAKAKGFREIAIWRFPPPSFGSGPASLARNAKALKTPKPPAPLPGLGAQMGLVREPARGQLDPESDSAAFMKLAMRKRKANSFSKYICPIKNRLESLLF
jgi:hypothetical protein